MRELREWAGCLCCACVCVVGLDQIYQADIGLSIKMEKKLPSVLTTIDKNRSLTSSSQGSKCVKSTKWPEWSICMNQPTSPKEFWQKQYCKKGFLVKATMFLAQFLRHLHIRENKTFRHHTSVFACSTSHGGSVRTMWLMDFHASCRHHLLVQDFHPWVVHCSFVTVKIACILGPPFKH